MHIETHCADESDGLVDWTHFHYCTMAGNGAVHPLPQPTCFFAAARP